MKEVFYSGAKGQIIMQLQQFLNCQGWHISMDGTFGPITQKAFVEFMIKSGYAVDKCVDVVALVSKPTKIDQWCLSIKDMEGYIAPCPQYPKGTPAWRNHNPGNLEFHNQLNSVANGRFAMFNTYQDGYNALRSMLIRACTGQMTLYSPDMTLLQFYEVYSPSSDQNNPTEYAKKVAGDLGVDWSSTPIKSLL